MLDGSRYSEFFPEELPDLHGPQPVTTHSQALLTPEALAVLEKLLRELQDFILPPRT